MCQKLAVSFWLWWQHGSSQYENPQDSIFLDKLTFDKEKRMFEYWQVGTPCFEVL